MEDRYVQQFKKGSLEMILLSLIGRKETYGYELIAALNASASVLGYAKEGTIYPILYRLQEGGLIRCRLAPAAANGGAKKYYSLTPRGQGSIAGIDRVLGELRGLRQRLSRRLSANGGSQMKKQYIRQVRKDLHIPAAQKPRSCGICRRSSPPPRSTGKASSRSRSGWDAAGICRPDCGAVRLRSRRAPEAKPADPNRYFSRRGRRRVRALCRRSRAARAARRDRTGGRHDEHPGRRGRV